ncbi:hypothetical protein [Actinoplanes sp. NPDC049118]|uniref:hypothetical protein n=1 Tax=Actinoplanes sp. NPDC049118 TaxID=3155769 RepID=UPI0033C590A7
MITDKLAHRAVALLAVGLVAAGCADAGATDTTGGDGEQALARSLAGIQAGNYTFTSSSGDEVQGSVHLPQGSSISQRYGPSVLRVGSTFYLKYRIHGEQHDRYGQLYDEYAAGATKKQPAEARKAKRILAVLDGGSWVRADEKRLVAAAAADDQSGMEYLPPAPTAARPDVTGATALADAAVSARLSGTTITGTLDATRIDPELRLFTNDPYYAYGPRARAMPYRATLDDQGRLTRITVDVPGRLEAPASQPPAGIPSDAPTETPEQPLTITVSRYGQTAAPGRPADAVELDPAAYEMLTNDID